jgi:hypothetical protein
MTISLLLVLAACSQDAIPTAVTGPEQNQLVARVQVQPTEAVLPPDEVLQLSAIVKGARGQPVNGRPVSWSSSDESVAYVDAAGNIVAGNEGTAVITANVLGVKGQATIDVRGQVIDIIVDDPRASLAEGDVQALSATYLYSNGATRAARYMRWSSSDSKILSIDGEGEATARDTGQVTVTAEGRGVQASRSVRVAKGNITSITVYASSTDLAVNEQAEVWAVILNHKGNRVSKTPTWSTSDATIVSVSQSGIIRGHAAGTATITAMIDKLAGTIDITVGNSAPPTASPGTVTDLSVAGSTETSLSLRFTEVDDGAGQPADYVIRYAEDSESFDWNSALDVSKGSCSVPLSGSSVGSTLTCSVDGLRASTTYTFQLVAFRDSVYGGLSNQATGRTSDPGYLVDVVPSSFQIDVGQKKQLTATVTDTYRNPVEQPVAWTTSSSSVATVSSGLVTGGGPWCNRRHHHQHHHRRRVIGTSRPTRSRSPNVGSTTTARTTGARIAEVPTAMCRTAVRRSTHRPCSRCRLGHAAAAGLAGSATRWSRIG